MEIQYPNYENSILNLICSILKYYKVEHKHPSLPILDTYLQKGFKNVVVMLFDGLGTKALEYHLKEDSFLRKHVVSEISSVFPPTTTSATTTIESGLSPKEHGWLGWSLYFNEIDHIVNAFRNTLKDSEEVAANYHVANAIIPYKNVYDKINESGNAKAYSVSPFGTNKVSSLDEMIVEVKRLCNNEGDKYIYSYLEQPDKDMHEYGCHSHKVTTWIQKTNDEVEAMCETLTDTIVIVTADHGHINLRNKFISDYPVIQNMLLRPIAIESRAACFYIKEEYKDAFCKEFYLAFGDDFLLLSKDEIIKSNIFGEGEAHPKFHDFIGDFMAIAISDVGLAYNHDSVIFKSNHAGLTKDEMIIPFIVIET